MLENVYIAYFVGLYGIPTPFLVQGVVGIKPFAVAQCVLSKHHKTAVQTADTACLHIGGLCWYPTDGTFEITLPLLTWSLLLPLGYSGVIGDYLLYS